MPKSFAVAILNWNGLPLLQKYLPSVLAHSQDLGQVYVIDNASEDGSVAWLKQQHPEVGCISLAENKGYAGGYNRGLQGLEEEYLILINSDIETSPGWLQPLAARLSAHPRLGALQPKILDLKDRQRFEYAGAAGGFIDALGYPYCRGRLFDQLEEDRGQYDQYRELFWASGACLVVRRSAFWEVGGLDEKLFAHMEEIDLCWRLQLADYRVACEPASRVYHLGGATLAVQSPRKTYLNFRNNLIILFLNLPQAQAFAVIMLRLVLDGLAALQMLMQGRPRHLLAVLEAHFAFYGRLHLLFLQKRKRSVRPWSQLQGVYRGSIVWDYFVRKRRKAPLP